MIYIKRFDESDSWAGSLYAYNNPIPPVIPKTFQYPLKQTISYKCSACDIEFYIIEGDDIICPTCKKSNFYIKEAYLSEQEYINDILGEFQHYNIRPVELNRLMDFYSDEIKDGYENDISPKQFVDDKVKDFDLDSDSSFMSQLMGSPSYNRTIKYL